MKYINKNIRQYNKIKKNSSTQHYKSEIIFQEILFTTSKMYSISQRNIIFHVIVSVFEKYYTLALA